MPVDVRIISATHRALRAEVEAGRFRADLMYRLRVIPIFLPPLRERPADVCSPQKIIDELNHARARRVERIAPAGRGALERYEWPGNVRELRNALAYAFAIGEGPILELSRAAARDRRPTIPSAGPRRRQRPAPLPTATTRPRGRASARALDRTGGNRDRAAKMLGLSRVTLWRRMRALGVLHDGSS